MNMKLLLDGKQIDGLVRASVTSNNYFAGDYFSFTVVANASSAESLDQLTDLASGPIELRTDLSDDSDVTTLIYGTVDRAVVDPVVGVFSGEGRDLSAVLVDSYVQQNFVNQTASEVVAAIAGQHGILAEVIPTFGNVGRYFADGYTRLSLGDFSRYRSNWDLIVELAREQNFDVYMSGSTLYFGPSLAVISSPVQVSLHDVITIQFHRNLRVNAPLGVAVQTWDSQRARASRGMAYSASTAAAGSETSSDASYLFTQPNLTPEQADARATMYMREICRLGNQIRIQMPWNLSINPRCIISVTGSGTSSDGLYTVDSVERSYSTTAGSTQFVMGTTWSPL
jgi:hypothetical protein